MPQRLTRPSTGLRLKTRRRFGLLALGGLGLVVVLGGAALAYPRRLDVTLGQPETVVDLQAGARAVTVRLVPTGNDNGVVGLLISVDGGAPTRLESVYDYDLFSDQPAGYWSYRWVDFDGWPDLVISTSDQPARSVVVGTRDGQVSGLP